MPSSFKDQKREFCDAKKMGTEDRCKNKAGFATNHPGYGNCIRHGGNMPTQNRAVAKSMARDAMIRAGFTDEVDIDPLTALLTLVRMKAGEIRYVNERIRELEAQEGGDGPGGFLLEHREQTTTRPLNMGKDGEDPDVTVEEIVRYSQAEYSIWVRLRNEAMRDLAKFSSMAISAGVAEKLLAREEELAEQIVGTVHSILIDLGVTLDTKTVPIVRRHLELLDGNAIEGHARTSL